MLASSPTTNSPGKQKMDGREGQWKTNISTQFRQVHSQGGEHNLLASASSPSGSGRVPHTTPGSDCARESWASRRAMGSPHGPAGNPSSETRGFGK